MTEKYNFNKEEIRLIKTIKNAYYMLPVIDKIDELLKNKEPDIYQNAFNFLHDIIKDAEVEVQKLINKRKDDGVITDTKQLSIIFISLIEKLVLKDLKKYLL